MIEDFRWDRTRAGVVPRPAAARLGSAGVSITDRPLESGTFTADAVSQIFTLQSPVGSNTAPLINALQLRNLGSPSAVPGAGLAGLATLGLAGLARRRRR